MHMTEISATPNFVSLQGVVEVMGELITPPVSKEPVEKQIVA